MDDPMERCPNCRAKRKNRSICGRCGMDLKMLLTIETRAQNMAQAAVKSLLAGDISTARQEAAAALDLDATDFHRALSGFIRKIASG